MPSIQLIKLTIRTGTEAQRQRVVLEQGELAYITDLKRMVVGDGLLSGGNPIGARIHNPLSIVGSRITLANAYKGDIVSESGLMWQLTAVDPTNISSWANIGTQVDDSTIKYNINNQLFLGDNSITGNKFATSSASGGLKATLTNGISAHPDYTTIGINGNSEISLVPGAITPTYLNSTALGAGLQGGDGTPASINYDPSIFNIAGSSLSLSALPPSVVTFGTINPTVVGTGLQYDAGTQSIIANLSGIDSTLVNNSRVIGLKEITLGATMPIATLTYDNYGRVTGSQSSVVTTFALSAKPTSPGFAWLSAYNGYPGQVTNGALSGVPLTIFQVLSSNGTSSVSIALSSAGFIALPYTVARDGKTNDRFAVPVFTY